jgi:hypothetical protein
LLQNYFCDHFQILLSIEEDWHLLQQRKLSKNKIGLVKAFPLSLFEGDESAALRKLPVGQPIHRMVQQLFIVEPRHVSGRVCID